jgi:hypothetical protein
MMSKAMIFGIAFLVALVAVSGQAAALNCNSMAFTSLTDFFGNPAFVYYENSDWNLPTVNLTINPGTLTISSGNANVNMFSGDTYTWQLTAATPAMYMVTVTATNSTNAADICTQNIWLNLQNPPNPAISPTMDDVQEEVIGQAFNVNAYLNNVGGTPAYNVTGTFDILNANSNSPQFTAQINNGVTATQTFQVTSANTCTYYTARIQVDYYDQNGAQMPSVYVQDTFNVSGPDLIVQSVTLPASAIEGSTITLSADVKNAGKYTSQAFNVDFYDGNPDTGGTLVATGTHSGTLAANASTTVSATWTASGVGTADIYARISGSMECFTNNNDGSNSFNITATCGDGYCNGGEGCGSCSNDCGACPPPAGGGQTGPGGGGGSVTGSCLMNYNCTSWSECTPEGIQTRVCEYEGNCPDWYAEQRQPAAERECRYTPEIPAGNVTIPGGEPGNETGEQPELGGLTGFIVANPGMSAGIVAAVIIIIGAAYYGLTRKGRLAKNG